MDGLRTCLWLNGLQRLSFVKHAAFRTGRMTFSYSTDEPSLQKGSTNLWHSQLFGASYLGLGRLLINAQNTRSTGYAIKFYFSATLPKVARKSAIPLLVWHLILIPQSTRVMWLSNRYKNLQEQIQKVVNITPHNDDDDDDDDGRTGMHRTDLP